MPKEREIFEMKMTERWSVQDLQTFLESIDSLYNFLFTLNTLEEISRDYEHFIREFGEFPPGEYLGKFFYRWFRKYPQFLLPYPFIAPIPKRPVQDIIGNLDIYVPFEHRLQLYRVEYKSPGSISFQGVADIIRELREWFTEEGKMKRQIDVEMKKIDLIEKKIEVLKKLGYNVLEIRELMGFGEKKSKIIEGLIKEGKLLSEGNLDVP